MSTARDKIAALQDREAREARLKKIILWTLVVVVTLGLAGAIGVAVWKNQPAPPVAKGEQLTPTKLTEDETYALTTSGTVADPKKLPERKGTYTLMVFDPQCPGCGAVDRAIGKHLNELNAQDKIALHFSPISFLNTMSSDEYSTRAVNAVVTVAEQDPSKLQAFVTTIFEKDKQPGENASYRPVSDAKLGDWAKEVGVNPTVADSFAKHSYVDWVKTHTEAYEKRAELFPRGLSTPAVYVGGKRVGAKLEGTTKVSFGSADMIADFDAALAAAK